MDMWFRQSVTPLTIKELHSDNEKRPRNLFDELIERRHGGPITSPNISIKTPTEWSNELDDDEEEWETYHDAKEDKQEVPDMDNQVDNPW